MKESFEQLQSAYIEALRPVIADVRRWWDARCPYPHTEDRSFEEMTDFHRRWIAGPAAHPRVLAVFRDYYFQIQDLNDQEITEYEAAKESARLRGEEGGGPTIWPGQRPIDLLVNDLESIAPDLFDVMQGLFYNPVGIDFDREEC